VIDLRKYHRPHGIAFLLDGRRVVVTAEQEQKALLVDIVSGEVVTEFDTEAKISHITWSLCLQPANGHMWPASAPGRLLPWIWIKLRESR